MKAGKGSWFHAVERLFKEDKDNKTSLNQSEVAIEKTIKESDEKWDNYH